jgi:hypothetical protein
MRRGSSRSKLRRVDPRRGGTKRALRAFSLAITIPLLLGAATTTCTTREADRAVLSRRGELQYEWARAHLTAPFDGYGAFDDLTVGVFDVILLSNLASGLMNVAVLEPPRRSELVPLASEVAERALSDAVAPSGVREGRNVGDHNLYASHLLLILGIEHRIRRLAGDDPSTEHDAIAERLARHLRQRSLDHASAHARSYPGSARWPADQSVTLAALQLHDREHDASLSAEPIRRWLAWLRTHETDGLPWSAVGALSYARTPRGCALSFMSVYMARFAPDEGARVYARYRHGHGIEVLGFQGFREWPRGSGGGSDVDAGPVIFGWGTAATGIGLGAARLYDDRQTAAGIERTADAVGGGVPFSGRYLLAPTLGQAMLFSGSTATPWDDPVPEEGSRDTGWPIGAALWLASLLALDGWLVRGLVRRG